MAEYLHLYRDDESGMTEVDYDLRGSVYWLESDGWTPATMPDAPYEERATVTEVLSLGVFATTAAGVADAIADLRRLLTEARRRASLARYPSTLTYLRHYPDGGSEDDYRTAEVVGGQVRWSKVLGRRIEQSGGTEYVAEIVMEIEHLAPLGEPETLRNLCPNPSFEWDTDNDGLANDWAEFGTTANQGTAIVAVDNAYGMYGQKLTLTDAITTPTGVQNTPTIAVAAQTEYHLKVWVDNSDNTNPLYVQVWDSTGSAWIATSKLTFAAGAAGAQQSVSFSTPAGCVAVQVMAYWANGAATAGDVAVVDGVYLGLKGNRAPQAWSSYWRIENHEDGPHSAPANGDNRKYAYSTDHNWVDVADVPGECEAVLDTTIQLTINSDVNNLIAGRRTAENPWRPWLWLQAEKATTYTDGAAWSVDVDAGASGNPDLNVRDKVLNNTFHMLYWSNPWEANIRSWWGQYRPFLLLKRLGNAVDLTVTFFTGSYEYQYIDVQSVTAAVYNGWSVIRGPVLRLPGNRPSLDYIGNQYVGMMLTTGSSTEEIRFDGLLLVPVDESWGELVEVQLGNWQEATGDRYVMSGLTGNAYVRDASNSLYFQPIADEGLLDALVPHQPQRLSYLLTRRYESSGVKYELWDANNEMGVTLTYRPRWLSL